MTNTIEAELTGTEVQTGPVFQFDYGLQLRLVGAPIEDVAPLYADLTVDGYNSERFPITAELLDIPARYFESGGVVLVFIVRETETARQTLHKITIPVIRRPAPPRRPEKLGPYTWPSS